VAADDQRAVGVVFADEVVVQVADLEVGEPVPVVGEAGV
jgi:hypothetical protein